MNMPGTSDVAPNPKNKTCLSPRGLVLHCSHQISLGIMELTHRSDRWYGYLGHRDFPAIRGNGANDGVDRINPYRAFITNHRSAGNWGSAFLEGAADPPGPVSIKKNSGGPHAWNFHPNTFP